MHTESPSPALDGKGIKHVQEIVGVLLFYARAVDNKLQLNQPTKLWPHFLTMWPPIQMTGFFTMPAILLVAHANEGFCNETKGHSQVGVHIFLAEDDPYPRWNGAILTVAQIIKFVMVSAAEAELGVLFVAAQKILPLCQTLITMGWSQPPMPIQTDNTMAVGVVNKTLVSNKLKSMDFCFHWLRCCMVQEKLRCCWDKESHNWGNYSTKHHPPIYHESKRLLFAGAAALLHCVLLT
jgi:hypothetical protein